MPQDALRFVVSNNQGDCDAEDILDWKLGDGIEEPSEEK